MLNASFRYVTLDVETTGLSPRNGHRIIEIGAVAIEGGSISEEFWSLVSVDRKIPQKAQRIHGITDEMLDGQPGAKEVLPRLYRVQSSLNSNSIYTDRSGENRSSPRFLNV